MKPLRRYTANNATPLHRYDATPTSPTTPPPSNLVFLSIVKSYFQVSVLYRQYTFVKGLVHKSIGDRRKEVQGVRFIYFVKQLHKNLSLVRRLPQGSLFHEPVTSIVGLLYLIGVYRSQHKSLCSLWSSGPLERALFSATFGCNRFEQVIANLHFDSREDRNTEDKCAAFRQMWEQFIGNCRKHHAVGAFVTIDK